MLHVNLMLWESGRGHPHRDKEWGGGMRLSGAELQEVVS